MEKIFEIRSRSLSLFYLRFLQRNCLQNFSKSPRFSGNGDERHPVCMHTHKLASLTSFDPVMVDIQKYWGGTCSQRADSYLTYVIVCRIVRTYSRDSGFADTSRV